MNNTPSKWGEESRDAGHDQMQIEVWEYLSRIDRPVQTSKEKSPYSNDRLMVMETSFLNASIEHPLVFKSKTGSLIRSFCDVALLYKSREFTENSDGSVDKFAHRTPIEKSTIHILEIKPKVFSVGAILRQIQSQQLIAFECGYDFVQISLVVREGEEKIPLLLRTPVKLAVWNGIGLKIGMLND